MRRNQERMDMMYLMPLWMGMIQEPKSKSWGIDNQTGSDTSGEDELIGSEKYHHSSIEDEPPSKPFAENGEYIPRLIYPSERFSEATAKHSPSSVRGWSSLQGPRGLPSESSEHNSASILALNPMCDLIRLLPNP